MLGFPWPILEEFADLISLGSVEQFLTQPPSPAEAWTGDGGVAP